MKGRMRSIGSTSQEEVQGDSEAAAFERAFIENEMRHADVDEENMVLGDNPSNSAGGSAMVPKQKREWGDYI